MYVGIAIATIIALGLIRKVYKSRIVPKTLTRVRNWCHNYKREIFFVILATLAIATPITATVLFITWDYRQINRSFQMLPSQWRTMLQDIKKIQDPDLKQNIIRQSIFADEVANWPKLTIENANFLIKKLRLDTKQSKTNRDLTVVNEILSYVNRSAAANENIIER